MLVNGMYLKKTYRRSCRVALVTQDRKNLAVHVSLSSNLHNVKDLTPGAALAGGVGGSLRLPNSLENRSLSPVARQQLCPFSDR